MIDDDSLEIVILGGVGEFGMNMMAFRHRGNIVVIDAGLMFPRADLLGVDLVIPDLSYLLEHRNEVRAVALTHGHEDHIGALPYLLSALPVPVYGTPLTLGFARGRLAEHRILNQVQLNSVRPRETVEVGDMRLEFLDVTHSIADGVGLAITTAAGTVIHSGDFKFDQSPPDLRRSDYARFAEYGERGVLALLSDSTNSENPGYTPSEDSLREPLEQVFHVSRRKIVVTCFASSIHRIQIILDLAREFGRKVVAVGRSLRENIAVARELGHLKVEPGLLVDPAEADGLPPNELVLLTTGSQGEPLSALSRLALGKHKDFEIEPGDSVVISARAIPGNETRISHLINHFCRHGARVYEERHCHVHVSGHGSQEDLKLMLNLTRPRFFIPIHGEYRQLYSHMLLARDMGIPEERILLVETGDIIRLSPDSAVVCGRASVGMRYIDEGVTAELDETVVRDRRQLSEEGIVISVIPISKSTGRLTGDPEMLSRGHVLEAAGNRLMEDARDVVLRSLEECTEEERADPLVLSEVIRADLRKFFRKRAGTRPVIVPLVLEI
ncbi:MAG: ribonuclease J [Acidobacteria bacterium]|nr:ribonuclease J [Acidobacteriota bacterium]